MRKTVIQKAGDQTITITHYVPEQEERPDAQNNT
jgi:hypothetical protein